MTDPAPGSSQAPARPDSVRLVVELWCAVIVAEIVAFIAEYPVVYEMMQQSVDQMVKDGQEVPASTTVLTIASMVLFGTLLTAVAVVVMVFFWSGRQWARQVLGALGAFVAVQLAFGVVSLFLDTEASDGATVPAWAMIFTIIGGVAAIGALAALMHRDTTAYCVDMAAWRSSNKPNGGMR